MHGRRARGYVLSDTAVFRMRGPRVRGAARRGGPAPERCPPGVINARPGLLNGPLAAQAFRDAVYHWWTRIPDKLTPDKMFVSYD